MDTETFLSTWKYFIFRLFRHIKLSLNVGIPKVWDLSLYFRILILNNSNHLFLKKVMAFFQRLNIQVCSHPNRIIKCKMKLIPKLIWRDKRQNTLAWISNKEFIFIHSILISGIWKWSFTRSVHLKAFAVVLNEF